VQIQTDSKGDTISGVVQSVQAGALSTDGTTQIIVNSKAYDLSQVLSVTPTVTTPTTTN
jgi:hypothetical protein